MRYNEATFKGTHNSYLRRWGMGLSEQLDYHIAQPGVTPVQSVELDLLQLPGGAGFYVSHSRREAGNRVEWFLGGLRRWAEANPGRPVVTVMLDLKWIVEPATVASHVDDVLRESGLPAFRPADIMQGRHSTLRDALVTDGWPDVSTLAGKFMFVTTGRWAHDYVSSDVPPEELIAFSSHDWRRQELSSVTTMNEDPWRAIVNVGYWDRKSYAQLARNRGQLAPHMVLRTWGGRAEADFRNAQSLGVNIIAVDEITLGRSVG